MAEININLENLQEDYMVKYMKSVVTERAVPDVRDGFKPIQRYVVWDEFDSKYFPNKPHVKCAQTVGRLIGLYSPHGDASAYQALVRLTQPFSVNIPLIDGHGNFGNIKGDSAGAYRYTESRLSKFGLEMCENINKNAVDFIPNYSNSILEPSVLPSKVCNLLIQGSLGIASGFVSSIPPHNINDVCDMTIKLVNNPDTSLDYVASHLRPDFPTGGIICNNSEITNAYKTNKGVIKIRAKVEIEEKKNGTSVINIKELPYLVTIGPRIVAGSSNMDGGLVNSIVSKIKDGTIEGISDIHDYTNKDVDIKIFIKKGYDPNVILNKLYKNTLMETIYKVQLFCLNNGKYKYYNIKEILEDFIKFRKDTIKRIVVFDINTLKRRIHILEGLIMALNVIDDVIKIIKGSKDEKEAKIKLKKKLPKLTNVQIEAILDMKLSTLTNLKINELIKEKTDKEKQVEELMKELKDENICKRIISEQEEFKKKYGYKRRTILQDIETNITEEDVIEDTETVITLNSDGYIKRVPVEIFKKQKRNTQGNNLNDDITEIFSTTTKSHLLCFTDTGRVFDIKVYKIEEKNNINQKGKKIESYLSLKENESVCKVLCLTNEEMENENSYLFFVTKKGQGKKTSLSEFKNIFSNGIIATKLRDDDSLVCVNYINDSKFQDVFFATKKGIVVRYDHNEFSNLNRNTLGVKAINLSEDDEVISGCIINSEDDKIFFATKNGLAKTVKITDMVKKKDCNTKKIVDINDGFPRLKRTSNIKGRIGISLYENDELVKVICISPEDETNEIIVISSNKILTVEVNDFVSNPLKRPTKGKKLISLKDSAYVKNVVFR